MDGAGGKSTIALIQESFDHRSGRVIGVGRLVLAIAFLVAIWLDPSQPTRAPAEGYAILAAYVLFAAGLLAATWSNWWLDRRLALPGHAVDTSVFAVMVFLTEGYTSPFFTFFVFLLLSATIRWGWRETAVTAAILIPLFFAAGVAALYFGAAEFELRRFLIRGAYLLVLSLILIWFGIHQRGGGIRQKADLDPETASDAIGSLIRRTMEFAAMRTGASRIVFAWSDREEPWLNAAMLSGGEIRHARFGPEAFETIVDPSLEGSPFLFEDGRVLIQEAAGRSRLAQLANPIDPRFAARFGISRGMAVPVESTDHQGQLFMLDLEGLSSDSLKIGKGIGAEIGASLERLSTLKMSEETAAAQTRLSLARDLHDSVVQLLAGTSFRLESLRKTAASGKDISPEIDALQQELSREQRELREFITKLRSGGEPAAGTELCEGLGALAEQLARQWGIECAIARCPDVRTTPSLNHEVQQLVREAVANAVRHGKAGRVGVAVEEKGGLLQLQVVDNGSGFPQSPAASKENGEDLVMPRSLSERVRTLGGTLALDTGPKGSRISMAMPMGGLA